MNPCSGWRLLPRWWPCCLPRCFFVDAAPGRGHRADAQDRPACARGRDGLSAPAVPRHAAGVFGAGAVFAVLAYGFGLQNPWLPFTFLCGGFFSALAGYIGMQTATLASTRTAAAARTSLGGSLRVAFRSGAVIGLVVVGPGSGQLRGLVPAGQLADAGVRGRLSAGSW